MAPPPPLSDQTRTDGRRRLLVLRLEKVGGAHPANEKLAGDLSDAVARYAGDNQLAWGSVQSLAAATLARESALYPGKTLAACLQSGFVTPDELVAFELDPATQATRDPPATMRRHFLAALVAARNASEGGQAVNTRTELAAMAQKITDSCFRATLNHSKASESPYNRRWHTRASAAAKETPTLFLRLFSERCAAVLAVLNPASSTNAAYRSTVARRLLAGELAPEALGAMSAAELCPEAMAAEKRDLKARSESVVEKRWSDLFTCTRKGCGLRKCTWDSKQMRSLDETATIKCVCFCGNEFEGK